MRWKWQSRQKREVCLQSDGASSWMVAVRPGADFRMLPWKRTLSRRRFLHRDAWRVSVAIGSALD